MESLNDLIVDAFWIIRIIYLLGICMGMLQVYAKVSNCIRFFCSNCIIEMAAALLLLYRGITVRGMGGWKGPARYCSWSYCMKNNKNLLYTCLRVWKDWNMLDLESRLSTHLTGKKQAWKILTLLMDKILQYINTVHLKFIWPRFAQFHCHRSSPGLQTTAGCASKKS